MPRHSLRFFAPSRLVKSLRLLFPVLFLLLLGVILIWPFATKIIKLKSASTPLIDAQIAAQVVKDNRLNNAVFRDVDDHGRPFSVIANEARQSARLENAVDLVQPRAEITLSDTANMQLQATNGLYKRGQKQLVLSGAVVVTHHDTGDDLVLNTERLQIDVAGNKAHTDAPVTLTSKSATINGQGMIITQDAAIIIFTGPATGRFTGDGT